MKAGGLFRRVGPTFAANMFNQWVVVLNQLALVPLLLSAWGADRYGAWILLSAIPTYLTLSDFGFTFIAKNEMTIKVVQGDISGAVRVFQSIFVLLLIIAVTIFALVCGVVSIVDLRSLFALGPVSGSSAGKVLLYLAANVIFTQLFLLQCAGVRSAGRPAAEVMWAAMARLSEGAVTGIWAWKGGDVTAAAAAIFASRVFFCLSMGIWLSRIAPWLSWGMRDATRAEVARLFHPSFSYMFISIANALVIQGPVVILGMVAQPETVVIFSTSRTLARLGTSAANLVNFSFSPEYSRLFGKGDTGGFNKLLKVHGGIAGFGITAYALVIWLAGAPLMQLWTHGKVPVVYPFFALLNLAVAAEMVWGALMTPLAAINRHTRMSYTFVIMSLLAIVLSAAIAINDGGLTGVTVPILAAHTLMIFFAVIEFRTRRPRSGI